MLGLQETRPAGSPSTRTYSCVACSATFHGLASLLVHQASHAGEISSHPVPSLPSCTHCGSLFASKDLLDQHHCRNLFSTPPTTKASPDSFICECGEGYHDFTALQEHRMSHKTTENTQCNSSSSKLNDDQLCTDKECKEEPHQNDARQSVPSKFIPSQGLFSHSKELTPYHQTLSSADTMKETFVTPSATICSLSIDQGDEGSKSTDYALPLSDITEKDIPHKRDDVASIHATNKLSSVNEYLPDRCAESKATQKKTLLEMLASAYMNRRQPAQVKWGHSRRITPLRKVSPRIPVKVSTATSNSGPSAVPFRHLHTKSAPKPISCPPLDIALDIMSSHKSRNKGNIVSMTRAFCPVVVLETRQKLVGYDKDDSGGRHQCGLCRKLFQDVDSLIMHHTIHRQERVKSCRRCQQLILSITPIPVTHKCSGPVAPKHFLSLGKKLSTVTYRNPPRIHSRKLFHCPLCNQTYTRKHNLRKHKCQLKASSQHFATIAVCKDETETLKSDDGTDTVFQDSMVKLKSAHLVNASIGTERLLLIKTDMSSSLSPSEKMEQSFINSEVQSRSPQSFKPFIAKFDNAISVQQTSASAKRGNSTMSNPTSDHAERKNEAEEGDKTMGDGQQWTVPLDDAEIDVVIEADEDHENDDIIEGTHDEHEGNLKVESEYFPINVPDQGVRRFICKGCKKSYFHRSSLNKHLKICGTGKTLQQHALDATFPNITVQRKVFSCFHCEKPFSRKDNMMKHKRRCQAGRNPLVRTANKVLDEQAKADKESIFVLPPSSEMHFKKGGSSTHVCSGTWGMMSLPSVLPRRVSCECGAVFTCPRLLFEHLQMHAQESYICPSCGENLKSWAEYEIHQQSHLENEIQTSQNNTAVTSRQQSSYMSGQGELSTLLHLPEQKTSLRSPNTTQHLQTQLQHTSMPHQRASSQVSSLDQCVCHRCNKTFRLRSSLLRHLRLSCHGNTVVQKKHTCSSCSMAFPNNLTLKVHMDSSICRPSIKPMRCPVCVRWFSSVDGLKKHLRTHSTSKNCSLESSKNSQSDVFSCQICQRSYPKMTSLKDHLRKVHHVKTGISKPSLVNQAFPNQASQFQCQICTRTYHDFQSLRRHKRRVHHIFSEGASPSKAIGQQNQSKQYHCQICQRTYFDIQSLNNHRRVHDFSAALDLSNRVNQQSQPNQFLCHICLRSYPNIRSLKNHRRRVHRILGGVL